MSPNDRQERRFFYVQIQGVGMEPKCPLCGAKTGVRLLEKENGDWLQIPDECHFCKQEDWVHQQNEHQGVDATQFGGGYLRSGKEAIVHQRQRTLGDLHTHYDPVVEDGDY